MDAARQIKARFQAIFGNMAQPVLFSDQRCGAEDVELSGYLTRGSGPEAGHEFRFQQGIDGLDAGSLLRLKSDGERWRVTLVREERMEGELLFVAAAVDRLSARPTPVPPAEVHELLLALAAKVGQSTLGPLETADAVEILERLPSLIDTPADPAHAARIKLRLHQLKELFKSCPQTGHSAQGLLLKLEAQLKRKGMP
jgi:hypothetical protein